VAGRSEALAEVISADASGAETPAALRKSLEVALRCSGVRMEAVSVVSGLGVAAWSLFAGNGCAEGVVRTRSIVIGSGASSAGRFFER
jgi:hypothetical protein